MPYASYAILSLFLVVTAEILRRRLSKPAYPPGPKGHPFIGNVRDIPPSHEWLTYAKWSRQYGSDVIHLNLLGSHLVILNSAKAASDLLDKRSAIYSDRPRLPMIVELMGWDVMLVYRYDDIWRASRRLFSQFFNSNAVAAFHPQMAQATHELLYRLAHNPDQFIPLTDLWASSLILNVTYGIDVQTPENPHLVMVKSAASALKVAGNPGTFLVDVLPLLKYVPDWFPGAGFKRKAKGWRKITEDTARVPFDYVKSNMEKGTAVPSMTRASLEQLAPDAQLQAQELVRATSASAFVAGSETTMSTMLGFFLAMVLHPDVLKKAQEELDTVVGHDRLPNFSDLSSLPYTNATIKEVYRHKPAVPLGFAHRSMEDDVYKGYFIPAGSIVLGNIWAITHDDATYKDPDTFNPDRYLKDGKLDLDIKLPDVLFGFGRRACPGRKFADASLFLAIASILSTFDIGNATDKDGRIIIPSGEYSSGLACTPVPFECSIKPRSKQALDRITEAYSGHHPN